MIQSPQNPFRYPRLSAAAAAVVALASATGGGVTAAFAAAPETISANAPDFKPVSTVRYAKAPASLVAEQLSKTTGVPVLVTGALSSEPVTFYTIGGSLDTVLPQLAASLPKGTIVRAAFVPVPEGGLAPDGDAVASYLRSIAALKVPAPKIIFRTGPSNGRVTSGGTATGMAVSGPNPFTPAPFASGQWEILDRTLPFANAAALAGGLNLRPVYLLQLPLRGADPVATMGQMQADAMRQWLAMTPAQRLSAAENQFSALMNMPSADRQEMLGQMMSQGAQMMKSIQNMPPDQQKQFMADITAAMKSSGMMPPPGRGGPPAP